MTPNAPAISPEFYPATRFPDNNSLGLWPKTMTMLALYNGKHDGIGLNRRSKSQQTKPIGNREIRYASGVLFNDQSNAYRYSPIRGNPCRCNRR